MPSIITAAGNRRLSAAWSGVRVDRRPSRPSYRPATNILPVPPPPPPSPGQGAAPHTAVRHCPDSSQLNPPHGSPTHCPRQLTAQSATRQSDTLPQTAHSSIRWPAPLTAVRHTAPDSSQLNPLAGAPHGSPTHCPRQLTAQSAGRRHSRQSDTMPQTAHSSIRRPATHTAVRHNAPDSSQLNPLAGATHGSPTHCPRQLTTHPLAGVPHGSPTQCPRQLTAQSAGRRHSRQSDTMPQTAHSSIRWPAPLTAVRHNAPDSSQLNPLAGATHGSPTQCPRQLTAQSAGRRHTRQSGTLPQTAHSSIRWPAPLTAVRHTAPDRSQLNPLTGATHAVRHNAPDRSQLNPLSSFKLFRKFGKPH